MAVEPPVATATEAVAEVIAGTPHDAARRWLGRAMVVAALAFAADFALVVSAAPLPSFDLPLAHAVQSTSWGPLEPLMQLTNWTSGGFQFVMGVVIIGVLFAYERRAGWLMLLGSGGSVIDRILKISVARHRPTADLVTILNPAEGFSFPSGHAVFYTWTALMLAVALAPRRGKVGRAVIWTAAGVVVFAACLGRVWAGVHWPSDVIGGFLLAIAWSCFILWLPERLLPTPVLRRPAFRRGH